MEEEPPDPRVTNECSDLTANALQILINPDIEIESSKLQTITMDSVSPFQTVQTLVNSNNTYKNNWTLINNRGERSTLSNNNEETTTAGKIIVNKSINRTSLRHHLTDIGLYIYIESLDSNLKSVSQIHVGKLIFRNEKPISDSVLNIRETGIRRVVVELKTFISANKLIEASFLKENKFEAFFPLFLLRRVGVIRGVDLDITNEEIESQASSFFLF